MNASRRQALTIRRAAPAEHATCLAIGRALPKYFLPEGIEQMRRDLDVHETWVVARSKTIIGFAVLERKSAAVMEIVWLAVLPHEQGAGAGSALLETVAEDARRSGVMVIEVKTLAGTVESPGYARTRRFYERLGFVLLDVIDPYPGWQPGNPCAIYVKPVG